MRIAFRRKPSRQIRVGQQNDFAIARIRSQELGDGLLRLTDIYGENLQTLILEFAENSIHRRGVTQ